MATKKIATNDRSMAPAEERDGGELYFFPKQNPPVSVRAASREEAMRKLGIEEALDTNQQEA